MGYDDVDIYGDENDIRTGQNQDNATLKAGAVDNVLRTNTGHDIVNVYSADNDINTGAGNDTITLFWDYVQHGYDSATREYEYDGSDGEDTLELFSSNSDTDSYNFSDITDDTSIRNIENLEINDLAPQRRSF